MPGCLVHKIPTRGTRPRMMIGSGFIFENRNCLPETYHRRDKLEQMYPFAHDHMLDNCRKCQHGIYAGKSTEHSPESRRAEFKPLSRGSTPAPEPPGKSSGRIHIGQHHSGTGRPEGQRRAEHGPCPAAKRGHNTFDYKLLIHIYYYFTSTKVRCSHTDTMRKQYNRPNTQIGA